MKRMLLICAVVYLIGNTVWSQQLKVQVFHGLHSIFITGDPIVEAAMYSRELDSQANAYFSAAPVPKWDGG